MSDYPMLISNKLHSVRNFWLQRNILYFVFPGIFGGMFCFSYSKDKLSVDFWKYNSDF